MPVDFKVIKLVSQLTKLTAKGELEWSAKAPPDGLVEGSSDVYPLYFETEYKGQLIGLAERRFQLYDEDRDRLTWSGTIVLVFIDAFGRVIWESTSASSALFNLLETVREKVADVDGILNNLLSDTKEDDK